MRLIGLAVVLALSLVLAPIAGETQETGKVARIGWLANAPDPFTEEFKHGLRELGYVESPNIARRHCSQRATPAADTER
jgi:hypothetical protein